MKKVTFGARPPAAGKLANPDDWVANTSETQVAPPAPPPEKIKRLTIDIPLSLHRRVKTGCAREELVIADVVREFLDQRFPADSNAGSRKHGDTESR
jgi:hypothetical protein